jgi:hypothetical protein
MYGAGRSIVQQERRIPPLQFTAPVEGKRQPLSGKAKGKSEEGAENLIEVLRA